MNLFIKNMVSNRCKMMVKNELDKLNVGVISLELGMVEISEEISPEQREMLKINLLELGLDLLDEKKDILTEKVKTLIIDMIHYSQDMPKTTYSQYISGKLGYDYTYLANTFHQVKGITIQEFIIMHKIERVKELILYGELNLTQISYMLHYSSVAYLSNQFKRVTGLSPSFYKQIQGRRTGNLENL